MSLPSPVSCVSDSFYLYRIYYIYIYCNGYYSTNKIRLMMSLMMMGLTPGTLVHAFLLFASINLLVVLKTPLIVLTNILVMSVAWALEFCHQQESKQLMTLICWSRSYQKKSIPKVVES